MPELVKAKAPFKFYTRLNLSELTGLRASTISQLLELIKTVPGSCIYHHTHRFLQQHQYLSPESPNDFAYWVTHILGEELSSIDIIQFLTINSLRDKFATTIEAYLNNSLSAKFRFARDGEEFHFIKSISFILPTNYMVNDLQEFMDVLKKITIDSIYFHIFEARLRLEKKSNDFSIWIEDEIGDQELAGNISRLDPYSYTLEDLRNTMINLINTRISNSYDKH